MRALIIARARQIPPRLFLVCAVLKVVLGTFSSRQIQYLSPSTKETYKLWVQRKVSMMNRNGNSAVEDSLSYEIESLDADASILWIGNHQVAKKIVLFFHGGGYIAPLLPGHLEWCWRSYVTAGLEMNIEVSVAILEYTLCPTARYPTQLRQAVSALSRLLHQKFRPQDIVMGGDSAGGNLTAQVLCHLIEAHPEVPRLHLPEPLSGVFLVSPWLTRFTNDSSFSDNSSIDMLSPPTVDKSTRELLGPSDQQCHLSELAFPLDRNRSCLKGMESVISHINVTVGKHEVLRDQVEEFVSEIQRINPTLAVQFEIQSRQAHDFILLEGQQEQDGECIQAMKVWMKKLLANEI